PLLCSARRPTQRSTLFPYTTLFRSRTCPPLIKRRSPFPISLLPRLQIECGPTISRATEERREMRGRRRAQIARLADVWVSPQERDRKSTRLNSSHVSKSYAVFCLKK